MNYSKLIIGISTIFTLLITSCDPEYCTHMTINNETDTNFYIIRSHNSENYTDTTNSKSYTQVDLSFKCALGGSGFYFPDYDSVYLKTENNDILKIYFPSDEGKNIFDMNFWNNSSITKRSDRFTFTISEDDFDKK